MSKAKTTTEYVYLEVKKHSQALLNSVTLCGPTYVLYLIDQKLKNTKDDRVRRTSSSLASTMEITLTGSPLTFMKASLIQEVSSHGFKPLSSIKDDSLTFSREVKLYI